MPSPALALSGVIALMTGAATTGGGGGGRSDRDRGIAELEKVDVLERIGAVRAAGAQIDNLPAAVGILRDLVGVEGPE